MLYLRDINKHPFWKFQGGSVPAATNSRLSPLPHEPAGFYDRTVPVDIPLDSAAVGPIIKQCSCSNLNLIVLFRSGISDESWLQYRI